MRRNYRGVDATHSRRVTAGLLGVLVQALEASCCRRSRCVVAYQPCVTAGLLGVLVADAPGVLLLIRLDAQRTLAESLILHPTQNWSRCWGHELLLGQDALLWLNI